MEDVRDYPKISSEILQIISTELQENPRFYTNVIDLMNRLCTPSLPASHQRKIQSSRNRGTQTADNDLEEQLILKKKLTDELFKVKAKKMLISAGRVKIPKSSIRKTTAFKPKKISDKRIDVSIGSFQLPDTILSPKELELEPRSKTPPPVDLQSNQIALKQLIEMPVCKNYQKGEKSQKLYIKNLAKEVTEEDLLGIYGRFAEDPSSIDIKLMQHGRMKGQAFVTFPETLDSRVDEALNCTLGFILKKKPMIVCYGKK